MGLVRGASTSQIPKRHHAVPMWSHRTQWLDAFHTPKRHSVPARICNAVESGVVADASPTVTVRMFKEVDKQQLGGLQAYGAGGRTSYASFSAADEAWTKLRNMKEGAAAGSPPQFVKETTSRLGVSLDTDLVVCGGTLGVFIAAALANRGLRVAVVERGPLRGREQEWNLSKKELMELVEVGVLTEAEALSCVAVEFNPVRVGFHGGRDVWTRDVLNLGVSPARLVQLAKDKVQAAGGIILENTALEGVAVHPDGASLTVCQAGGAARALTCRLVLDVMGHASPAVKQQRWGVRPDGVCLVVGALCRGFAPENNTTGDIIATFTPMQPDGGDVSRVQYFWEAFPAGSAPGDRTTYMFAYMDAEPWRPSLSALMEDYWRLMPQYQRVELDALTPRRILYGCFPTFRSSPLRPAFDRVMQLGDASGIQSPLSFGGFGALTRHLRRLTAALQEALAADVLDKDALGAVNAYNPGLSSAWMLQRAMSVRRKERLEANMINRMLGNNFAAMQRLGDPVMKPFLQDVIQFGPLMRTLAQQVVLEPGSVPELLAHVGPGAMADWLRHVSVLGVYDAAYRVAGPALRAAAAREGRVSLTPRQRFMLRRTLDAWEFGSGNDYRL